MTLQNRVTPFGELIETEARGTLMGNRGILHDGDRNVVKRWAHQQWIHCALQFKGRKRTLMKPGNYTELFFLDEATAFAAGHRPCGECQRAKYRAFKLLLEAVHGQKLKSAEIDRILHGERLAWQKGKRTKQKGLFSAEFSTLPDSVMIHHNDSAHLKYNNQLLRWTPFGYEAGAIITADATVTVLTPRSMVSVIQQGYLPALHPSAEFVA